MQLFFYKIDKVAAVQLLDKNFNVISKAEKLNGDLLKITDKLLKKVKKKAADLTNIIVANNSGTFSGVRNVITTGNALSFALKIPITSVAIGDVDNKKKLKNIQGKKKSFAASAYGKKPNIT